MIDPERKQWIFGQIGYTAHSIKQAAIHDSIARFKILACGRRYGKTTFGGNELTACMCDPTEVGYYWIVGPNYVQGEKEFRVVYHNLVRKLGFGSKIKKQYNVLQGNMRIEMPWGTILEVKSAERKDSLLGEGLLGVVMAEAARHSRDTWEQYVRPTLTDAHGWAIFPSTPRGYNWFQGLWLMGTIGDPMYESWRLPSWENPIVYPGGREDPELLEIERNTSPQFFAQEYAAEFTAFAGKIYDEFDPKIHVRPIEYNPMYQNFWVFDYGWNNPFVCLDVMVDSEDNVYVWREYQVSHMSSWEHGHILIARENPEGFHLDGKFGDPRGADSAANLELVIGSIFSEQVETEIGVEYVKRWLKIQPNGKPKLFIDPSCTDLIRQMEQLHYEESREDKNPREGQYKHDDHGPDALRYFMGQYFYLGAGASLSDVYSPGQQRTEAATFFRHHTNIPRYARY